MKNYLKEIIFMLKKKTVFRGLIKKLLSESKYWGKRGAGILPFCQETGKFLVGLRSDEVYEPNTWNLFGGKIDDEDLSPKEAAERELSEELEYYGNIKIIDAFVFEDKQNDFTYYNFIGVVDEEFEPVLNWEHDDAVWVSYEELMRLSPKHFGLKALLKNSKNIIEKLANE